MEIRDERATDTLRIRELIEQVFGAGAEAALVDQLRADGDLAVSLLAGEGGRILGHVALSRLASPSSALALAPVSVAPDRQRQGIGSALVREALTRARRLGAAIVFVLGDPAYYGRFGFDAKTAQPFSCVYAGPYFLAIWLGEERIEPAPLQYAKAFSALT